MYELRNLVHQRIEHTSEETLEHSDQHLIDNVDIFGEEVENTALERCQISSVVRDGEG